MSLADLVVDVHRRLSAARRAHAFGGALALAYIAEPRGTVDVDVNVFSPVADMETVIEALAVLGLRAEQPSENWMAMAGIRLRRDDNPYAVDVFPSLDERYGEIQRRCVRHPFGSDRVMLPFLSAEDLAVFKLSFGRDKDWVDLRAIARSRPELDVDYIERQLLALRGAGMHPRIVRLRTLLRAGVQRSFRLAPRTLELLDHEAEASATTRNALADRLLGEALRVEHHPLVRFHLGAGGRRQPLVVGTRLYVHQVVATLRAAGGNLDEAAEYLGLPPGPVQAARNYYADFQHEVDADAAAAERSEQFEHER
ncbi:MAG: hypothetical protein M3159_00305 [Actinomycetota bacterium]|nr:hypothetical protein [Actinomycetota bacterium]